MFVKNIGSQLSDEIWYRRLFTHIAATASIRHHSVSTSSSISCFCNTDIIDRRGGNISIHIPITSKNKHMEFDLQLPRTLSCHVPLKFILEQVREEVEVQFHFFFNLGARWGE